MEYQFEVGYQVNKTSDTEHWYTVQEAASPGQAREEMKKRYPEDQGYSFHSCNIPDGAKIISQP